MPAKNSSVLAKRHIGIRRHTQTDRHKDRQADRLKQTNQEKYGSHTQDLNQSRPEMKA